MININVQKLNENAVIPQQGSEHAAGFDLTATDYEVVNVDGFPSYINYKTGIAVEIPVGYVGLIYPRSSISNKGLSIANSVGVVDADYRGEITIRMYENNVGKESAYKAGDRIAQMIIMSLLNVKFSETNSLSSTKRGEGAYGSTGN